MTTTTHQKYYVPHDSALLIVGALALLLIGYGGATWISQLDQPDARSGPWVFAAGLALLVVTLFGWLRQGHRRIAARPVQRPARVEPCLTQKKRRNVHPPPRDI